MAGRHRIGLVLGGGAARGWAHIGVFERLAELGIVPDIVCGTSIGALVGAGYVTGRLDALRDRALSLRWAEMVSMLDVNFTTGGLIQGSKIEAFLTGLGISGPIEGSACQFAAVATDMATGREVWLQDGAIEKAVRASIGIPGIFSPVLRDERWLLDGGLVNPVPVSLGRALGADVIIAVDLNSDLLGRRFVDTNPANRDSREFADQMIGQLPSVLQAPLRPIAAKLLQPQPSVPGYFDVLANALNIMQDHITRTRLAGEPPHVLLQPRLGDMRWVDFHRAADAIAEGRACVDRAMPALQRYLDAPALG